MSATPQAAIASGIKDLALADSGRRRIEWAFQSMPVLQMIRKQFIKNQPLAGVRVSARLHVTAETANLMVTLRDGGAHIALCASDPLSTQDDASASLVRDYGVPVFAIRGETSEAERKNLMSVIDYAPHLLMDDGGDLIHALHTSRQDRLDAVMGATEESAAGLLRIRAIAKHRPLRFAIIAAGEAQTTHLFDNRYGTGQSTIDGILRATHLLFAGSNFVIAGYGRCGRGIALRARGLGANVIVTEVDPLKAIEAALDGFRVMNMSEAAAVGDVFCTVTGNKSVIAREHFEKMRNGAILANAGHSNIEIDLESLARMASSRHPTREFVEEYSMRDGRKLYVLAEGRLINLAAAEGHPASVMDIAFANQALAAEYIIKSGASLDKKVSPVRDEIDRSIAKLKLEAMGVKIDRLTIEQEQYLSNWSDGI
jgi:adenosylhomocysteinase